MELLSKVTAKVIKIEVDGELSYPPMDCEPGVEYYRLTLNRSYTDEKECCVYHEELHDLGSQLAETGVDRKEFATLTHGSDGDGYKTLFKILYNKWITIGRFNVKAGESFENSTPFHEDGVVYRIIGVSNYSRYYTD